MMKRHQNVLSKKVADQFQCFCIELNRSDTVFGKLNGYTKSRQLLNEHYI